MPDTQASDEPPSDADRCRRHAAAIAMIGELVVGHDAASQR